MDNTVKLHDTGLHIDILLSYINTFSDIDTHQSSLDELFLACLSILLLATPGFEGRGLQGTAV